MSTHSLKGHAGIREVSLFTGSKVRLDCKQSLFCSKIRGKEHKEERNTSERSWASERNMLSHEPQVAGASEDERLVSSARQIQFYSLLML